jgi:uncharacterized protein (TIGR00290 family)
MQKTDQTHGHVIATAAYNAAGPAPALQEMPRRAGWSTFSWSGGKDSALALETAINNGARPGALLTMLDETGHRSRSHGLRLALLQAQAAALGLPLVTRSTSWSGYTSAFTGALTELAAAGCAQCVFGDIDNTEHRDWCERVSANAGVSAVLPLWQRPRHELVEHLLTRGWKALIVVIRTPDLDGSILGRPLDRSLLDELDAASVDVCGENGEFHTVVTDGPLFSAPLLLEFGPEYGTAGWRALFVRVST